MADEPKPGRGNKLIKAASDVRPSAQTFPHVSCTGSADQLMRDLVGAERASCAGEPPADYDIFEFRKQDRVRQCPRFPPLRRSNCPRGSRMCNCALTHAWPCIARR